jgi:hypothetical protein
MKLAVEPAFDDVSLSLSLSLSLPQRLPLAAKVIDLRPHARQQKSAVAVATPARFSIRISRS